MKTLAKIAFTALALSATAAAAGQGDKITALGYGPTQHHAKIITIQTWTAAAQDAYGYADWNTAYIGHMECIQNPAYASNKYSTLSREIIKIGGDQSAPWSCIVSGYQDVKTTYGGDYGTNYKAPVYKDNGYKAPVYKAPVYKKPVYNNGHTGGFTPNYNNGYTGNGYTGGYSGGYSGGSTYKY